MSLEESKSVATTPTNLERVFNSKLSKIFFKFDPSDRHEEPVQGRFEASQGFTLEPNERYWDDYNCSSKDKSRTFSVRTMV